jgi:single-strand DNA-binding protein
MNIFCLTGRVAEQPVRRDTNKGVVCEFRLAAHGRPRLWITIVTWGHLAGVCAQHLRAGRTVAVTGALHHDQYTNRAGERSERWYCKAADVTFLGPLEIAEEERSREEVTS